MGDTIRHSILGHGRWNKCIRTQWLRQLHYDTVDGKITIGHSIWENYIRTQ